MPPTSVNSQISSPALSLSRGEHERLSLPLHLPPNMSTTPIQLLPPPHASHLGPPLLPTMPGTSLVGASRSVFQSVI